MHKRGLEPSIFPISKVDYSSFKLTEDFKFWLKGGIKKANKNHNRSHPIIRLWHLNGSLQSFSKDQVLLTFYELDQPTDTEINTAQNQRCTIFTSNYCKSIFQDYGVSNIKFIPLGFDNLSFYKTNKQYLPKEVVVFNLLGKLEKRKGHLKILRTWARRFGNDRKYCLNCAIFNPFIEPKQQEAMIAQALGGKKYFNMNFIPFMSSNEAYNDMLNAGNIVLGLSGGEGWGLGEFQSLCLGKHGVILNAHSYQDWANAENSILVEPDGKEPAYDGLFFKEGSEYNQGNIFTWSEDAVIEGMEKAIKRYQESPNNDAGEKLKDKFTYSNTVDQLLKLL